MPFHTTFRALRECCCTLHIFNRRQNPHSAVWPASILRSDQAQAMPQMRWVAMSCPTWASWDMPRLQSWIQARTCAGPESAQQSWQPWQWSSPPSAPRPGTRATSAASSAAWEAPARNSAAVRLCTVTNNVNGDCTNSASSRHTRQGESDSVSWQEEPYQISAVWIV